MDIANYLQFGAALALVLGLIGLAAWAARRFGLGGPLPRTRGRNRRLSVVEVTSLDPKRRIALVRRDGVEHLLLLGPSGDVVVERGIDVVASPLAVDRAAEEAAQ